MSLEETVEYILHHYRWIFVCFFLLPCSFLYDIYIILRNWICFWFKNASIEHNYKVHHVQKQTIAVEPSVNIGQISAHLIPVGWTLPIIPELESLTVGGLVNGQGVESSSHKYGLFQHICISFEIVVADGSVLKCSKEENTDLFFAIPWSYGTLGFLTAVELQIIPCKRFVELTYQPVYSLGEAVDLFEKEIKRKTGNEFVEGIMFSKETGVIMTGHLVDSPKKTTNAIGRWYKQWFYKHVESFFETGKSIEYIPLRDYYHRHTRSLFWTIEEIIPFGNHWIFRWIFGWMTPPKISFLKLTQTGIIKKLYLKTQVFDDTLVPLSTTKDMISFYDEAYNVYPLWLCPFKLTNEPGFVHSHSNEDEYFVDIGIYGRINSKSFNGIKTHIEHFQVLKKSKSYEMLYAGTFATREEFREMFDHTLYDRMRKKFNCEMAFPEIYDKVNKDARN
ncbi:delta(24)-sterol reductase isoform X2 [Nilaparvata lugens]|uniref:delta(24)-sterol reductase isoform X2 n=1 Tax=Nilaparvata lugens TaxID=108931 RepID=UPI000B97FA95|nr:delta(24)-sterol reductase isoform X2 [Nilaparvata lugens]